MSPTYLTPFPFHLGKPTPNCSRWHSPTLTSHTSPPTWLSTPRHIAFLSWNKPGQLLHLLSPFSVGPLLTLPVSVQMSPPPIVPESSLTKFCLSRAPTPCFTSFTHDINGKLFLFICLFASSLCVPVAPTPQAHLCLHTHTHTHTHTQNANFPPRSC
jgi:hypothetical protein